LILKQNVHTLHLDAKMTIYNLEFKSSGFTDILHRLGNSRMH